MDTPSRQHAEIALPLRIVEGGLDDARVAALLEIHLRRSRSETAAGSAHALDLSGLKSPDIRFWTAWRDEILLGCGALRLLTPKEAELKSMHTAEAARRQRVGSALLRTIMSAARDAGMARLSLETGSWPYFAPAIALYSAHGFVVCRPFGDYREDPNSVFMTRDLRAA